MSLAGNTTDDLQGDVPAQASEEERKRATAIWRAKLEAGEIDLGPITTHEPITGDHRDMRDPQALGEAIQASVREHRAVPSHVADYLYSPGGQMTHLIPDFSEDLTNIHAERRRKELEERAANGDRFAAALLSGDTLAEDPVD